MDAPRPLVHETDTPTMDVAAPFVMLNGTLAEKLVPVVSEVGFAIQLAKAAVIGTVKSLV